MIIFAQTNGKLYNMINIEKFEKEGDTKIKFFYTNGRQSIQEYADSDTRDKAYNNLITEFVKNINE
jgi:hypothetical protein